MSISLKFFEDLAADDLEWFLDTGAERSFAKDEVLVEEGSRPPGIYFILDGLAEVRSQAFDGEVLARLGHGEIVGEMSFLEDVPAAASVVAAEATLVLGVHRSALERRLEVDSAFAARFYRALARGVVQRLRNSVAHFGRIDARATVAVTSGGGVELSARLETFKDLLLELDRDGEEASRSDDRWWQVGEALAEVAGELKCLVGDNDQTVGKELGARVRREILPWLLLSEIGKRLCEKPRGYVGDYLTIARIYADGDRRAGETGRVVDSALRAQPAIKAIRGRRALLAREIAANVESRNLKPVRVTSMACGPASEVFDAFAELANPGDLKATLIDVDSKALELLGQRRDECGFENQIALHGANLVYLALGREQLELPPQHLIYSMALIDTLSDRYVLMLLDFIYDRLAPGGRVLLGVLHPSNPSRALMKHVLGWDAKHRYESDVQRLFETSKFACRCSRILWEDERVNYFAECVKR